MDAYCTLIYSDDYLPGALVLAHALKDLGCSKPLIILITAQVSPSAIEFLEEVYDDIIVISPDILEAHGYDLVSQSATLSTWQILGRPELGGSIGKLFIWTLADNGYGGKIVYLDADVLPLKNLDFIFSVDFNQHAQSDDFNWIAASPDVGWPDIFNSGFFVTRPSNSVFEKLWKLATENNSFDGGDQGILNEYFTERSVLDSASSSAESPSWIRLPFTYNFPASSSGSNQGITTTYGFNPAFARFKKDVSVIHFIGYGNKPWTQDEALSTDKTYSKYYQQWKEIYDKNYKSRLGLDSNRLAAYVRNLGTIQVDPGQWDPTKTKPPIGQQGEAYALRESAFVNVWDEPRQAAVDVKAVEVEKPFTPKPIESRPRAFITDASAIFAAAEAGIANEDFRPSSNLSDYVKQHHPYAKIFPWENKQRVVTRVFPSHNDIQKQFQSITLADENRKSLLAKSKAKSKSKCNPTSSSSSGFGPHSEAEEDYEGLTTSSGHKIMLPVTPNPAKILMQMKMKRTTGVRREPQNQNQNQNQSYNQNQNQPRNYTHMGLGNSGGNLAFGGSPNTSPVKSTTARHCQNSFGRDSDSKAEVWDPAKKLEELAQASSRLLAERLEILRKNKEEEEKENEEKDEDEDE